MYHGTPNSDPEKIKTALWNLLSGVVSDNIFISNRQANSDLSDFAVIGVNGAVTDFDGYSRCTCFVQLFAKDIDKIGTSDMTKLSSMYDALLSVLPSNKSPYTFSKGNQIGSRDSHGFHLTMVNLDCLIY